MKIRIIEKGWAGYTGDLGAHAFVDSVSVNDVGQADAAYLAGIVSIENVETGKSPSVSQLIVDSMANSVPIEKHIEASAPVAGTRHAKDELEAIADASGIKGIREIAEPLGLKGNSISELIEKVLSVEAALASQTTSIASLATGATEAK